MAPPEEPPLAQLLPTWVVRQCACCPWAARGSFCTSRRSGRGGEPWRPRRVSLPDGIGCRGALGQLCSEAVSAGPPAESRAPTGKSLLALSAGGPAPEVPKQRHQQPPAHGQGRGGPPASRAPCALRLSASAGPAPPPEAGSRHQPSPPPSHPADLGLCRHAVTLVLLATAPRCHSRSRPRSAPWSSSPLTRPVVPPHGAAGRPRPAAFALRSWLLAGSSHSAPSALQPLLGTSPRQVSGL